MIGAILPFKNAKYTASFCEAQRSNVGWVAAAPDQASSIWLSGLALRDVDSMSVIRMAEAK